MLSPADVAANPIGTELIYEDERIRVWRIDLEPGAYELDVFALFELGDGLSGDTSGSLGLLVGGGPKEYDYSGVVALDEILAVRPFGE